MCGRYKRSADKDDLQSRFGFINPKNIPLPPRYNIAPTQNEPTVIVKDDQRELILMRWGLIPPWAKDASIGYKMINARGETIAELTSFKRPFRERRCLVMADGFYEWERSDKKNKIPYLFVLKNRGPFAFAAIWEQWKNPKGELVLSFSLITTPANELMAKIHDRMPVILHEKDEAKWLDPQLKDPDKLKELLVPYPSELMEAYQVSRLVNSAKNESPDCIKPIEGGAL
jgi:putative SOS response-associated peptidase YedK